MPAQSIKKEWTDQNGRAFPDGGGAMTVGIGAVADAEALPADVGVVAGQYNRKGQEGYAESVGNAIPPEPTLRAQIDPSFEPTSQLFQSKPQIDYQGLVSQMLDEGDTLADLSPEERLAIEADDGLVHYISQTIIDQEDDPEEAQRAIWGTLAELGVDTMELRERASAYNRFANGVSSTLTSVASGVGKALPDIMTDADRLELVDTMSDLQRAEMERDSELYKALYPTNRVLADLTDEEINSAQADSSKTAAEFTDEEILAYQPETSIKAPADIATVVGQEAPGFAVGGAASKLPKVATAIDAGINAARMAGGDEDVGYASILAPAVGYGIAKSLEKFGGRVYEGVKDYEKAVKQNPQLEEEMLRLAKDKGITSGELKIGARKNLNKDWDELGHYPEDFRAFEAMQRLKEGDPFAQRFLERTKGGFLEVGAKRDTQWLKDNIMRTLIDVSDGQADFLDNIIKYADVLKKADPANGALIRWAQNTKKLSPSAQQDAVSKLAISTIGVKMGIPLLKEIMPTAINKWTSNTAGTIGRGIKKVLTAPIGD